MLPNTFSTISTSSREFGSFLRYFAMQRINFFSPPFSITTFPASLPSCDKRIMERISLEYSWFSSNSPLRKRFNSQSISLESPATSFLTATSGAISIRFSNIPSVACTACLSSSSSSFNRSKLATRSGIMSFVTSSSRSASRLSWSYPYPSGSVNSLSRSTTSMEMSVFSWGSSESSGGTTFSRTNSSNSSGDAATACISCTRSWTFISESRNFAGSSENFILRSMFFAMAFVNCDTKSRRRAASSS
mmetsp:Transcript_28356/g.45620  ORF Transcript_28356/g.45620 Transcript_28356/m.45620 type:complete len:247 (-) Transcript_28356:224-964(-)